MTALPPIRMPSNEWGGKDRPAYYRSPSSQLRHQRASNVSDNNNNNSQNPFASKDDPVSSSTTRNANTNPYSQGALHRGKDVHPDSPASPPVESGASKTKGAGSGGVKSPVGSAIESVSETVKPYLPGSIAAYLPTSAAERERLTCELPSKEIPSGSVGGVGSLPGTTSETSVAKLPDERMMEKGGGGKKSQKHPHHHHHHQKHGKRESVGKSEHGEEASTSMYQSAKNYIRRSVGAYLPGSIAQSSQLPSKETPGGSAIGVGSLPGTTSEVSVAKLPEERRLEGMPSHETDHEVLGKSGGVGALPGGPNESRVALLPEERIHPQYDAGPMAGDEKAAGGVGRAREAVGSPLKKSIEHEHERDTRVPGAFDTGVAGAAAAGHHAKSTGNAGFGGTAAHPDVCLDPGYHPAALHPIDPKFTEKQEHKGPSQESYASAVAGDTSRRSPESEGRSSISSGERRKTKLMNKVKGEVKVIAGKLSHNEKKVEEGKQLKGQ